MPMPRGADDLERGSQGCASTLNSLILETGSYPTSLRNVGRALVEEDRGADNLERGSRMRCSNLATSAAREEKPLKGANPMSAIVLKDAREAPEGKRRREVVKTWGRIEVRLRQGRTLSSIWIPRRIWNEGWMAEQLGDRRKSILNSRPRGFPVMQALKGRKANLTRVSLANSFRQSEVWRNWKRPIRRMRSHSEAGSKSKEGRSAPCVSYTGSAWNTSKPRLYD